LLCSIAALSPVACIQRAQRPQDMYCLCPICPVSMKAINDHVDAKIAIPVMSKTDLLAWKHDFIANCSKMRFAGFLLAPIQDNAVKCAKAHNSAQTMEAIIARRPVAVMY
jgi:hypothetical protein